MLHIKKFIDKISHLEGKNARDVILPIADARGLRDDIAKLLSDLHELNGKGNSKKDDIIKVELTGGKFK